MLFYELEKYYGASMVIEPEAESDKESRRDRDIEDLLGYDHGNV